MFYNYSIDCELPPEGSFGGPATWEIAEASVRGFIEVMTELDLRSGASLFVYPDVAKKQASLFREIADAGVEVALHLNGLRYSRIAKPAWLGAMSYGDQREAIRMGKADLEDVLGRACLGYRACYLSGNDDTFPICEELGLQWTSTSGAGSEKPDVYACWKGGWPFPYHPSRENRLVPGDMKIYDMPITRGIHTFFQGDPERPIDLRAETPPEIAGDNCEVFRQVIRENIEEMARRDQPVRGIFPASHNTSLFADESTFQHGHLVETCRMARELVEAAGHAFVPASYLEVKTKADEKPGPER